MKVKRSVANVEAQTPAAAIRFYHDVIGQELAMDLDWVATYRSQAEINLEDQFHVRGGIRYTGTRSVDRSRRSGRCAGAHAGGRVSDSSMGSAPSILPPRLSVASSLVSGACSISWRTILAHHRGSSGAGGH